MSGFYFCNLALIPALYIFFLTVLKPAVQDPKILYRWHRKLQAHHRLTFAMILAVNAICWTPFHLYLLTACLTCQFSYLANGFVLEYLYMIALAPSLIIPLMFSIRSSVVDKCASKIARCVTFARGEEKYNHNPLSAYHYSSSASGTSGSGSRTKSPLFYIDELSRKSSAPYHLHQPRQQPTVHIENTGINHKLNFFVPKYLPTNQAQYENPTGNELTLTAPKPGRYVKQSTSKHNKQSSSQAPSSSQSHPAGGSQGGMGALKNFRTYINKGYRNDRNEPVYDAAQSGNNSNDELVTKGGRGVGDGTDDTDSQCGFPIPSPPPSQNAIYASHYYSRLNIDGNKYGYR